MNKRKLSYILEILHLFKEVLPNFIYQLQHLYIINRVILMNYYHVLVSNW